MVSCGVARLPRENDRAAKMYRDMQRAIAPPWCLLVVSFTALHGVTDTISDGLPNEINNLALDLPR